MLGSRTMKLFKIALPFSLTLLCGLVFFGGIATRKASAERHQKITEVASPKEYITGSASRISQAHWVIQPKTPPKADHTPLTFNEEKEGNALSFRKASKLFTTGKLMLNSPFTVWKHILTSHALSFLKNYIAPLFAGDRYILLHSLRL